jgi:hypothetical protein
VFSWTALAAEEAADEALSETVAATDDVLSPMVDAACSLRSVASWGVPMTVSRTLRNVSPTRRLRSLTIRRGLALEARASTSPLRLDRVYSISRRI